MSKKKLDEEDFEKNLGLLFKETSHLLGAVGIFGALALGVTSAVPGVLGICMAVALFTWVFILLSVFLFKVIDAELGAYFKAYLGFTLAFVIGGVLLHILFMLGNSIPPLPFYAVIATVIWMWLVAALIIFFSLRNSWIRNIQNIFGKAVLASLVVVSLIIAWGIYLTNDVQLREYVHANYGKGQ